LTPILSILICALAVTGIMVVLRKGKEVKINRQDPQKKSSGELSSIEKQLKEWGGITGVAASVDTVEEKPAP